MISNTDIPKNSNFGLRHQKTYGKTVGFKWSPRKGKTAPSKTFRSAYPDADCRTITPQDFLEFLFD